MPGCGCSGGMTGPKIRTLFSSTTASFCCPGHDRRYRAADLDRLQLGVAGVPDEHLCRPLFQPRLADCRRERRGTLVRQSALQTSDNRAAIEIRHDNVPVRREAVTACAPPLYIAV